MTLQERSQAFDGLASIFMSKVPSKMNSDNGPIESKLFILLKRILNGQGSVPTSVLCELANDKRKQQLVLSKVFLSHRSYGLNMSIHSQKEMTDNA